MTRAKSMVNYAEEYLAYRRALGFRLHVEGRLLLQFAAYVDGSEHRRPISTELALTWARLPQKGSPIYWAKRIEVVRGFCRYLAIFEPGTEIPPERILGPAHRRTQPYIYSEQDISALLQAAAALSPAGGLRPCTYVTFLGLLACAGLRVREALNLARDDVDLKQGVLLIRETKFRKSRLVPVHPSTTQKLRDYASFRNRHLTIVRSERFFLSADGTALAYSTVRCTFVKLRQQLGWRAGHADRLPRIYDLRHTFACRRVLKWYQEGRDVDRVISSLETWSGRRDRVMLTTFYNTGARVSEIIRLCVSDINLEQSPNVTLHGKGRKQRVLPLWKKTARLIKQWVNQNRFPPDRPLFPNTAGRQLTRSGIANRLKEATQTAAKCLPSLKTRQVTPHTIRHTTAMHLLQSGVDLTVIALWLGHEKPSTTHMYMEADMAMKKKALGKIPQAITKDLQFRPKDQLLRFLETL